MIIKIWRYGQNLPAGRPRGRQTQSFDVAFGCSCYIFGIEAPAEQQRAFERAEREVSHDAKRAGEYIALELDGQPEVFGRAGHNLASNDIHEQIQQIAEHAAATGLSNLYHYTWSHRPGEEMTASQMRRQNNVIRRLLQAENCPAIESYHGEKNHQHGHGLLVALDSSSGEPVLLADGWWKEASQIAIAICERDDHLRPEPNRRYIADEKGVSHFLSGIQVADADGMILRRPTRKFGADSVLGDGAIDGGLLKRARDAHAALMKANDAPEGIEPGSPWSLTHYVAIVVPPRLQAANSWEEVHRTLAPLGLQYRKVGNTGRLAAVGTNGKLTGEEVGASAAYANAALGKLSKRFKQSYTPPSADLDLRPLVMPRFNTPKSKEDETAKRKLKDVKEEAARLEAHLKEQNKAAQHAIYDAKLGRATNEAIARQAARSKIEQKCARDFVIAIVARATRNPKEPKHTPLSARTQQSPLKALFWSSGQTSAKDNLDSRRRADWRESYELREVDGATEYHRRGAPPATSLAFTETENLVLVKLSSRRARLDALNLAEEKYASLRIFGNDRTIADTVFLAAELGIRLEDKQEDEAETYRDEIKAGRRRSRIERRNIWIRMQEELALLRERVFSDRRARRRKADAFTSLRLNTLEENNQIALDDARWAHTHNSEPGTARKILEQIDRNQLLLASSREVRGGYRYLDDEVLRIAFAKKPQHLLLQPVQQQLAAIEAIQIEERKWIAAALLKGRAEVVDGKLKVSTENDKWAETFWHAQAHDPSFRRLLAVSRLVPQRFDFDLDQTPEIMAWRHARKESNDGLAMHIAHEMDRTAIAHGRAAVPIATNIKPGESLIRAREDAVDQYRRKLMAKLSKDEQVILRATPSSLQTPFYVNPWPRDRAAPRRSGNWRSPVSSRQER